MKKRIVRICAIGLILAIVTVSVFFAYPALTEKEQAEAEGVNDILRVWHIDTFEGGKGSRASFLGAAAKKFEKKNKDVLVMVVPHSVSSARVALDAGEAPDMISFGTGGAICPELFLPLEKYDFPYSKQNGKTYAVPWCRGNYMFFTLDGDFTDMTAQNTVISEGNYSMALVAAACESLAGGQAKSSVSAYVDFLNGKYKYLFGTQRDVARLNTRGAAYTAKPAESFSDLYQYIAVLSSDAAKYNACLDYVALLLSESVQKDLKGVGMMSAYYSIYDESNAALQDAEKISAAAGVSAFIEENSYAEMRVLAVEALGGNGESLKKMKNFLI